MAMNPIIKFTTLFGLLAVEMAVQMHGDLAPLKYGLAVLFLAIANVFVWRSFYGMRIKTESASTAPRPAAASAK